MEQKVKENIMQIFLVTLTIDNGCRLEKWRITIPEENRESAIKKQKKYIMKIMQVMKILLLIQKQS